MALPLSPAADQDQSPDGFVPAGYAQLLDEPNAGSFDGVSDDAGTLDSGGNVVSMNGVEIHIYGDARRLGFSSTNDQIDVNLLDRDEEADEEMRTMEAEMAVRGANEADEARRSAPLPPEHCGAIKDAMRGISLGGFRPDWADRVPEEQWIDELKRKSVRKLALCGEHFSSSF